MRKLPPRVHVELATKASWRWRAALQICAAWRLPKVRTRQLAPRQPKLSLFAPLTYPSLRMKSKRRCMVSDGSAMEYTRGRNAVSYARIPRALLSGGGLARDRPDAGRGDGPVRAHVRTPRQTSDKFSAKVS